jgi:hypothetical protein
VYLGGKTHVKVRSFDPTSYDTVAVTCDKEQHARSLKLALHLDTDGQVFSKRVMLASKFVSLPDTRDYTFFFKLCCELLQAADALPPQLGAERLLASSTRTSPPGAPSSATAQSSTSGMEGQRKTTEIENQC